MDASKKEFRGIILSVAAATIINVTCSIGAAVVAVAVLKNDISWLKDANRDINERLKIVERGYSFHGKG